jgi:hypothetical protein
MIRVSLFAIALLTTLPGFAQVEGTLQFMNSLPQVVNNNPAFRPIYKGHIGLPGSSFFVAYTNNGFTYNDLVSTQNGTTTADLSKLSKTLRERNFITQSIQFDLFRMGFQLSPKFYLMGHVTAKSHAQIMVPKNAIGLFVDGTTPYVNGVADLTSQVNGLGYLESALGASIEPARGLRIGFRAKFIQGAASINTVRGDGQLVVDNNYNMTASANVLVTTSGINALSNGSPTVSDLLKNTGFGLDAGATLELLPGLKLSASILDLGFISWKNDLKQYSLDPTKATYTFRGIDINRILDDDDGYLNEQLDSLQSRFELDESTPAAYRTGLPTRMLLSGELQVVKNFSVGGLMILQAYKERINPTLVFSANKNFGRGLTTSFSYTISNNGWNNLGAGLSLNMAPFQIYVVGDNLLRVPIALVADGNMNNVINSAHFFNLRAGLNFVWGRMKSEQAASKSKPTGNSRLADIRSKKRRR